MCYRVSLPFLPFPPIRECLNVVKFAPLQNPEVYGLGMMTLRRGDLSSDEDPVCSLGTKVAPEGFLTLTKGHLQIIFSEKPYFSTVEASQETGGGRPDHGAEVTFMASETCFAPSSLGFLLNCSSRFGH